MKSRELSIITVRMGNSNAYLVIGTNITFLVDTGVYGHIHNLETTLLNNGLDFQDIDLIIITHSHYDHVGNLCEIKEKSFARILAHANESGFLKEGYMPIPKGTSLFSNVISWMANSFSSSKIRYNPVTPDILVDGDCELLTGGEVKILTAPGHTSGSICVIVNNKYAIVGDTIFNVFKNSFYPLFADDEKTLIKTWDKLLSTGCKIFYPGHGKPVLLENFNGCFYKISKLHYRC